MRISELQRLLRAIKRKHGDIQIITALHSDSILLSPEGVFSYEGWWKPGDVYVYDRKLRDSSEKSLFLYLGNH